MTQQNTKMHTYPRRRILIGVGILILALAILVVQRASAAPWTKNPGEDALTASGIIQAEEVSLASGLGGRIVEIPVSEGTLVSRGDLVIQLNPAVLDAQIEAAQALIAIAEAGLAQAQAGAGHEQIAVAEAQLAQAKAGRDLAKHSVADTQALLDNPQQINMQIALAQSQLESAKHKTARAMVMKDAAEMGKEAYDYVRDHTGPQKFLASSGPLSQLPPEIAAQFPVFVDGVYDLGGGMELHIHGETFDLYQWVDVHVPGQLLTLPHDYWLSWVGVQAAMAEEEGIEASLAHLYAVRNEPQDMQANHDQAVFGLAGAEAMVTQAEIQVEAFEAGASKEQIAALEARVAQTKAVLEALMTQRDMLSIESPLDGTVTGVVVHPGEVAAPGASLLTVADLSQVTLIVYVAENRIGLVRLNQPVQIKVDSFADRVFEAHVSLISNRAEFTPRNVATKEERVNLVFAVEITIANQDGALKPGMPADALFLD